MDEPLEPNTASDFAFRGMRESNRAHADAIPGVEILANDVRCTHAAAIAQSDKEQLFYLRAGSSSRSQRGW